MKLSRRGDRFSAFHSVDGRRWSFAGRAELKMPDEVLVGIGSASGAEGLVGQAAFDWVEQGATVGNSRYTPQVHMTGGSIQKGRIRSMDNVTLEFEAPNFCAPLSVHGITTIRFQPVPQRFGVALNSGNPGVLLGKGEFIEGDCQGIRNGELTLSSIPLGLCRYDVASEVLAVVMSKRARSSKSPCEVSTTDGSVWRAREMSLDAHWVVLRDPSYGVRRVPFHSVFELRWNS